MEKSQGQGQGESQSRRQGQQQSQGLQRQGQGRSQSQEGKGEEDPGSLAKKGRGSLCFLGVGGRKGRGGFDAGGALKEGSFRGRGRGSHKRGVARPRPGPHKTVYL